MTTSDFEHFPSALADSMKWHKYAGRDVLPMWVADMDFAAPPPVLAALRQRLDHGMMTYNVPSSSQVGCIVDHLASEYDWPIEADWLVWLPGLVPGLNIACRAVGEPDSAVFTATPIYPPFMSAPRNSGRRTVGIPLARQNGRWGWDFDRLSSTLADHPDGRLFLLCHPHNPVGRVWRDDELQALAAHMERHDLIVCSDEIHCGLLLDAGLKHRPFATLSPEIERRSITLMAPSKTYNLPGLATAFAIIPDASLRRAFRTVMQGIVPSCPNTLGMVAAEAAYRDCAEWRSGLLATLRGNRDRLEATVARLPGLKMTHVEATYLGWIDASELCNQHGIDHPQRFFEEAGVGLSPGADFGPDSHQFVRLNFGCPQATLEKALVRITTAIQRL
ncbi:MalY/PatB family protein [Propionivibrio limicola]|uniref:MalY/PatB family protein n=1 Tax=Propionivibrio limicola TaxID=167645 RepID=UPI0012910F98|nr:PatB family C-S lyase [Propionivibrio limicola]